MYQKKEFSVNLMKMRKWKQYRQTYTLHTQAGRAYQVREEPFNLRNALARLQ